MYPKSIQMTIPGYCPQSQGKQKIVLCG